MVDLFQRPSDVDVCHVVSQADIGGVPVRVGGFAKGSGMIHPNMATMLCVITSDAAVAPPLWRDIVRRGATASFNQVQMPWRSFRSKPQLTFLEAQSYIHVCLVRAPHSQYLERVCNAHARVPAQLQAVHPSSAPAGLRAKAGAHKPFCAQQISVDGDTSTNDTVIGLASGAAGGALISDPASPEAEQLEAAVTALLQVPPVFTLSSSNLKPWGDMAQGIGLHGLMPGYHT